MHKNFSVQQAGAMARGDMRRPKKDAYPYHDFDEQMFNGTASLQKSNGNARRELDLAQARIRSLELQLQQMDELVRADQLTGMLNRRGLDEAFEREFARATRHDAALCVALLDLDNFKRINDDFGHAAGDAVLVHFARIVHATLRSMDVLARFGGEEFVILLPSTTPLETIKTMTRIQAALATQPCQYEGVFLPVTFSAGAAAYKVGEEKHTLMKRADAAVYKAKHAGKNQVIFTCIAPQLVPEALAA
jgi:diguanylate cyclase